MTLKKTKIICTIGPSSSSADILEEMMKEGMDVVRLNFSHGTHEEKQAQIELVRQVARSLNKSVAIIADLQGPKLRLGQIEGQQEITKGQQVEFSYTAQGNQIPLQFDLAEFVKKGERIFVNDGLLEFHIDSVADGSINATARNNGWISSHKGINIPDTLLRGHTFTEKDRQDAAFALVHKIDYIALSFIQTVDDIIPVKALIESHRSQTKLIAKIEKNEALENLDEIVQISDAVMVARGDLAIETSPAEVPVHQQRIIRIARQFQKPAIVATQMLESMIHNPRPTRAEASDVAHAVLFQVDAVMLSAESAVGKYPVEAVKVMHDIIVSVEHNPEFKQTIKINWEKLSDENLGFNAIASSAAKLAFRLKAPFIAVASSTGRTVNLIASFRPDAQIVAVTHDEQTQNQLTLLWGVHPVVVHPTRTSDEFWERIIHTLLSLSFIKRGSKTVMIAGTIVGTSGATDTIRVVEL